VKTKTRHALWMRSAPGAAPEDSAGWTFHDAEWNELPEGLDVSIIERVVLMDFRHAPMPTTLRKLPNVRVLNVSTYHLAFTPADVPQLEELHILGTSDVELPRGPWPNLRMVEGRDAPVSIADASELPVLEELVIRSKGTRKVFAEIGKLSTLKRLRIGPVKDDATLALFAALPLRELGFNRGSIASLKGVARFTKLTGFGAMNCHDFADLGPLAEIPALGEVWFNTCAGIKKPDALLQLPKLKRVMFWGCRDNGGALKKVCKKLMAKGVKVDTELFE
jgi:hypothetical protein